MMLTAKETIEEENKLMKELIEDMRREAEIKSREREDLQEVISNLTNSLTQLERERDEFAYQGTSSNIQQTFFNLNFLRFLKRVLVYNVVNSANYINFF